MAKDTGYKGWANYATWRIQLEVFSGLDLTELGVARLDLHELQQWLSDYVYDYVVETTQPGLARDYAHAFLSDVNWYELAQAALEDTNAEHAD